MRILALDVGDRRIGVAVSDPTGLLASPVGAIERSEEASDVQQVLAAVAEHQAERIVVGIPISLDGRERQQARLVRRFCAALRRATSLPVTAWDERYSTVEAQRLLREAGGRPSRERGSIDAAAAAVILQAYLDSQRRVPSEETPPEPP